jgi:hypothetical protein
VITDVSIIDHPYFPDAHWYSGRTNHHTNVGDTVTYRRWRQNLILDDKKTLGEYILCIIFDPALDTFTLLLLRFNGNEIHTDNKFNSEYGFYHLLLQELWTSRITYRVFPLFIYLFFPVPLVVVDEASCLYEACHV